MKDSCCIPFVLSGFVFTETVTTETELHICLQSVQTSANCPMCKVMSQQEHSSYLRQVQDTPIGLFIVRLQLKVRRFRCPNPICEQQTFAEQFHGLVGRRRQRTDRLIANLTQIGLALGGKAGARLAGKLAMIASPSTLLRLLHRLEAPAVGEPRIIGIDDWAFRKGRDYGTIIVDHESGKVIDLLAKRDCAMVKAWLEKHPTVETVTPDRSGEYREAISQALPDAVQIADRWHLLKNLRETVERHFSQHYQTVRQLVANSAEGEKEPVSANIGGKHRRYAPGAAREALHAARTEERGALFAAVKARLAQGVYTTDVAKEFNLSRQTVSKWLHCETLPPDTRGRFKQKCMIDHYAPYLHERIQAGCTNPGNAGAVMAGNRWPRSSPGFAGGRALVGKWIRQNYRANTKTAEPPICKKTKAVAPCPRELAWLLIRHSDELEAEEKQLVNVLLQDDALAELRQLAHQFIQMVRNGHTDKWAAWIQRCCHSAIQELKNFAIGLERDHAAVYEAVAQSLSNGRTEGHVNRLKFLKRQMYGRASFDLLRLRVLLVES
jgi:transposase